ncbi:helix-turn-helix domain-containing protein [Natranaerovirga hydrolytica]|uniref:helix-turn-helix domain-containing protein n=1 Tax=Natranaerovirga hydrolytica TaxID=680378 RepID=UPI0014032EFA|nr:helix-turn-helix transcriptional regulator [Natranaerovirga hydrolytica]
MDYELIGERIKMYRKAMKMTQHELSEKLDVSNVYISRIERGTTKINLEMLYKISIILNVSISLLLTGVHQESDLYLDIEFANLISQCDKKQRKLIYELIKVVINT